MLDSISRSLFLSWFVAQNRTSLDTHRIDLILLFQLMLVFSAVTIIAMVFIIRRRTYQHKAKIQKLEIEILELNKEILTLEASKH